MMRTSFASLVLIMFLCVSGATLFVAPQPARAIGTAVTVVGGPGDQADIFTSIKQAISTALDYSNTAANVAKEIKAYVLDPLAFIMSGNLLKSITSSILGFVGGKNGTGKPLYVQNLQGYLQNVGDVQAYNFLAQFSKNSNSPFASSISSSLRNNYLQETSLAGFFAANKNTLGQASSNPTGFLAGNWSLGGVAAWFSLTTQCQNNPYCFYYTAQNQMARSVQGATSAKLAQLNWGQGFLSWCGSKGDSTSNTGTTGTGDGGTETCTSYDLDGNCTSGPLNDGGTTDSDFCPIGTFKAGTGGCANTNTKQFELPTGYSCSNDTTFDGNSGGCQYDDGFITVPFNASGQPAYPSTDGQELGGTNVPVKGSVTDPNIQKGIDILNNRASEKSLRLCAQYTRIGLAGMGFTALNTNHPESAYQYGPYLTNQGFTSVGQTNSLLPGDTVVFQPIDGHPHGHIAVYTGSQWVSDYKQKSMFASEGYKTSGSYTIYRPPAKTSLAPQSSLVASAYTSLGESGRQVGGVVGSRWSFIPVAHAQDTGTDGGGGYITTTSSGTSGSVTKIPKPGDPCTKADGTEGQIQTPGSIIKDHLSRALNALGIDQFIPEIGLISSQISGIMSNISTVMQTVNLATSLFGGSAGGLSGFSGNGSYTSPFADYLDSSAYLGVTAADVGNNTTGSNISVSTLTTRINDYEAAWIIKKNTAQAAKDALLALKSACTTQAGAADTVVSGGKKVLDDAAIAARTVADSRALVQKVEAEGSAGDAAYAADLARLSSLPPSVSDAVEAQQDALAPGSASANPAGSLQVGGGTTADRMNLLVENAAALKSSSTTCPAPVTTTTTTP